MTWFLSAMKPFLYHDGSNMGMDVGEAITLEQCLYGIMVGSANEVANATAEHIGGTIDNFITMMNEKLRSLAVRILIL